MGDWNSPNKVRSIGFYLPTLGVAGAERHTLNLLPELMKAGMKPYLILTEKSGALIEQVPPEVEIISLDKSRTIQSIIPLARLLRKLNLDVLISALGHNNIAAILACAITNSRTRLIVCQQNTLSIEARTGGWQYSILPLLYRVLLGFADGIIAVSKGVADDLVETARIPVGKISVIYNSIVDERVLRQSQDPAALPFARESGVPVFVSVGRLAAQKDHVTLLEAFRLVIKRRNANLCIIGDGPLKDELRSRASKMGIEDKVHFLGLINNPYPYMKLATAVVVSSVYEGLPTVIVEALAIGTAVVSTRCPHGPEEILENGRYGVLVPVNDPVSMAEAMEYVIENSGDQSLRIRRAQDFTAASAAFRYAQLIDNVLERS